MKEELVEELENIWSECEQKQERALNRNKTVMLSEPREDSAEECYLLLQEVGSLAGSGGKKSRGKGKEMVLFRLLVCYLKRLSCL